MPLKGLSSTILPHVSLAFAMDWDLGNVIARRSAEYPYSQVVLAQHLYNVKAGETMEINILGGHEMKAAKHH